MGRMTQAVLAATLCAVALDTRSARAELRGEIVEFGEITAEQERSAVQTPDDHSLVPRTVIEGIRFVSHTSSLSAQLCLRFGVSIWLTTNTAEPLPRQMLGVVTHPLMTRPDQTSSTKDSFPTPVIGNAVYVGWTFDHAWELQPGDWTIAFQHEGEVVASKTFSIAVPESVGSVCPPKPIS